MCEFSANIAAARPKGLEEVFPLSGQKHAVPTSFGPISVVVYGDRCKSPLVTYPDVALNYESCFQGLFRCPEASSLLSNFCIYHIDAPGHEAGAKAIDSDHPILSVEDLADQVAEVLDYFRLWGVMCMGVTAGAYILTLFASKYRERVNGLILVSPLCRAPSWTEWIYNEVTTNLLYYGGMCDLAKEILLQRHFSKDSLNTLDEDSDKRRSYCKTLDERQSTNVIRYMHAINRRPDLTDSLKNLKCRTLVFVGELSPFHHEAIHLNNHMDRNYNALVEVQVCGTLVTEEQPHSMLIPMEYFLMGYGFYRPCLLSRSSSFSSPSSPLSPLCISPELLSPESLGVKLRPIKTRVPMEDEEEEEPFL